MIAKPVVDVLLGTYNGGKYLEEFLNSLIQQHDVSINLIVSDDGSTDKTIDILKLYKDRFPGFKLVRGPGKGAAQNYLSLLHYSQNRFAAFADQDDIWDSRHLINSVDRLNSYSDIPALSYSAAIEYYEDKKKPERIWPDRNQITNFDSILFKNYARGCTIALNKSAVDLINSRTPKHIVMHDWWALQVVFVHGEVIFAENPEVFYRIHDSNVIGVPHRWKSYRNFLKQLMLGKWGPMGQAMELNDLFGNSMDLELRLTLDEFLRLQRFSLRQIFKRISHKFFAKEEFVNEISLRFIVFLIPIAARNWK